MKVADGLVLNNESYILSSAVSATYDSAGNNIASALSGKQNKLSAGEHIAISNDEISVSGIKPVSSDSIVIENSGDTVSLEVNEEWLADHTVSDSYLTRAKNEGSVTVSSSYALGTDVSAAGEGAVAEGSETSAIGNYSHAEGGFTYAYGYYSHAEGTVTVASGIYSHAEGTVTVASGDFSHAEGYGTTAVGQYSHTEGNQTITRGNGSHAEGYFTTASGDFSHAEGSATVARGVGSHAEGWYTSARGEYSHAEGSGTSARGDYSHAEGNVTVAYGTGPHAEGNHTSAFGNFSHAEGSGTSAAGTGSHAEGYGTSAIRNYSHAEGNATVATGTCSHAEGINTTAYGSYSHAEGSGTSARGDYSHAEGFGTITSANGSHAQGKYNTTANATNAFIIGNGTSDTARSDALVVDWNGNVSAAGYFYDKDGNVHDYLLDARNPDKRIYVNWDGGGISAITTAGTEDQANSRYLIGGYSASDGGHFAYVAAKNVQVGSAVNSTNAIYADANNDYNDSSSSIKIKIGYAGNSIESISPSNTATSAKGKFLAGYVNYSDKDKRIKDVSPSAVSGIGHAVYAQRLLTTAINSSTVSLGEYSHIYNKYNAGNITATITTAMPLMTTYEIVSPSLTAQFGIKNGLNTNMSIVYDGSSPDIIPVSVNTTFLIGTAKKITICRTGESEIFVVRSQTH